MRHVHALLLIPLSAMLACATGRPSPIDEPSTLEGLQRVEVKGIDAVYRRPGANLSAYNKLLLHPVQVAFAKNWERDQDSPFRGMSVEERLKIKQDLAEAFLRIFRKEIETEGGYQLVTEPDTDVLEFQPGIFNLYIAAPAATLKKAGRGNTYVPSAGEMTLVAEMRDSITGELQGRVYDRSQALETGMQWATAASNSAEATRIISSWARTLRKALDASRGKQG
jgi:hypothetical protein